MNEVLIALIGGVSVIIPAFLIYRKDMQKIKFQYSKSLAAKDLEIEGYKRESLQNTIKGNVLDSFLDFASYSTIKNSAEEIFSITDADRFLLLFAINGKEHFNHVSVFFEQHKDSKYSVSAIAKYKSLTIDSDYGKMLKRAENEGMVALKTADMPEDSLLRMIYEDEGIMYSDVRHLVRVSADTDNDILVFSSLATHKNKGFTKRQTVRANIIYDSIIKQTLIEVLKKNNYK